MKKDKTPLFPALRAIDDNDGTIWNEGVVTIIKNGTPDNDQKSEVIVPDTTPDLIKHPSSDQRNKSRIRELEKTGIVWN